MRSRGSGTISEVPFSEDSGAGLGVCSNMEALLVYPSLDSPWRTLRRFSSQHPWGASTCPGQFFFFSTL